MRTVTISVVNVFVMLINYSVILFIVISLLKVGDCKMRVCVIGSGAAGLCAVRHLAQNLNSFEILAFEQTDNIGGTWVYTDETDSDYKNPTIHSSMYKSLRTNLPGEIMNFPDFQKTDHLENKSILTQEEVLQYLEDYSTEFQLKQYFQFNKRVERVTPNDDSETFNITVNNLKSGNCETFECDAVMVCNGHFFQPYIPNLPGMSSFTGQILHSHSYRKPDNFSQKRIIILGASYSGIDISKELSSHGIPVYLSHNKPRLTGRIPEGVTEVTGIKSIKNNVFSLMDGTTVNADVLIFCTGYNYSFPFLDEKLGIEIDEKYVKPLYKHIININYPRIGFIGIPTTVVPFPLFHMQVQYFIAVLKGQIQLPSKSEMIEDSQLKNITKKYAHKLEDKQWTYYDNLAFLGHFEPLPEFYRNGYTVWSSERRKNMWGFKNMKLLVSSDKKNVALLHLG